MGCGDSAFVSWSVAGVQWVVAQWLEEPDGLLEVRRGRIEREVAS